MRIKSIEANQSFKGIKISKNMPKEIVTAIRENPVIKRAGRNYSLWFSHSKNHTMMSITTPNIDSPFSLLFTPPHSIKRKSYYLGTSTRDVLNELEDIEHMPKFFERMVGTPRTFKQRLTAFIEAWKMLKISVVPDKRTVMQEVKMHKILDKYKNMNMFE